MKADLKLRALAECREQIVQYLDPQDHFPFLKSRFVVTHDDQELVENKPTRTQRADKLVDILLLRGAKGYDELCASLLNNRTQIFLLEKLHKQYEQYAYADGEDQHEDTSSLPRPTMPRQMSTEC